ncbi:hypothetical protein CAEBREN_10067 [Caenorhabditis brenneri]|uniref:Zinc finger PHD-type domain-containing protein n=1 Tax=Caenorhabditis brenneri TaxID=135651 RepID=G0MDZ6_CAEBE|nr:hypothetical protein CAEBREN_10067 [Caenorhabditis brenneri]
MGRNKKKLNQKIQQLEKARQTLCKVKKQTAVEYRREISNLTLKVSEIEERESQLLQENIQLKRTGKDLTKENNDLDCENALLVKQHKFDAEETASKNLLLLQARTELKETEKKRANLEKLIKTMESENTSSSGPPPKKARCHYNAKSSTVIKDSYCNLALESMEKLVGEENLDDFASYLVQYIAKSDRFSFQFNLDESMTAYCKIRFGWSDAFMKEFKSICKERLGFDVLSSRVKTGKLLKQADPNKHFDIKLVEATKKTSQNKTVQELTPVVTIRNLKNTLEGRLSMLAQSGRLHSGDLVLGVGGDKGGDTTKLCLIIQNTDTPNNPLGILLLGMYHGADNHENLEKYMSPVFKQINELTKVEFDAPGGGKDERNVRKKPIGDCLYLSACLHHKGPTSSNPCFICEFKYSTHGFEKALVGNTDFQSVHTLRTLSSLSISGRPLLNINPEDYGIPPVHTIHGVTQKYGIDPLIAKANYLDLSGENIPVNLSEQKTYLKELKNREEICLAQCEDSNSAIMALDELKKHYQNVNNKNPNWNRRKSQKCSSPSCAAHFCKNRRLFNKKEFLQCIGCGGFFHFFCVNVVTSEEKLQLLNGLSCRKCTGCDLGHLPTPSDYLNIIDSMRTNMTEKYKESELEYCTVSHERQEVESQLKNSAGFYRKKLEKVLRDMGCDHRVWYQEMTGNQIRKLLRAENIKKLVTIFPDSEDLRQISDVLMELSFLMSNSDNAEKTDSQIDDIEKSIGRLVDSLKKVHKDSGVILKLHLLSAHLVSHLRDHRSWGRVSEQGIESLHALINKLNRTFASVRNPTTKTALILQYLLNQNALFDAGQIWKAEK